MQVHKQQIFAIAIAAATLQLVGCDKSSATAKADPPKAAARTKAAPGGVKQITLKDIETKRLGISFAEVTKTGERLTMPYNALVYDPSGGEWTFTSPEPNVYMRSPLKVETIEGDNVYLAKGPAVGTKLVTNGAAELYGIEFGIGK